MIESATVDGDLYSINPATGAFSLIGPVRVEGVGAPIIGLAMPPRTHVLYAVTGAQRRLPGHLLTVDPHTGVARDIGQLGVSTANCRMTVGTLDNIAFRADGAPFGFGQCGPGVFGNLHVINLTTGAATFVGALNSSSYARQGFGLAFLPPTSMRQELFVIPEPTDQNMYVIDPGTGRILGAIALRGGDVRQIDALTAEPGGTSLLGVGTSEDGPVHLLAINPSTGKITVRGTLPPNIDVVTLDLTSLPPQR